MKVAVVGCTHAGTAAVSNIANLHPEADITVYERNDNVSFLSCGIALYVGGVVKDPQGLFYSSPEKLEEMGVTMKMKHEVLDIDTNNRRIRVKNLDTNEELNDTYDKLVMATGSWPVVPPIEGIKLNNILLSKNYNQANTIIERAKGAKRVTVIGAGYIGVELVEAFQKYGKEVTLIDGEDRILSKYLDPEFTDVIEEDFRNRGIRLALNETVTRFEGDINVSKVVTSKGEYESDLVILCVGFRPNTELVKGQVDMLPNGAIIVDDYMRTSKKDIYAAGDSCAIRYNPTGEHAYIPLATNAVRMGTLVGRNIMKPTTKYMGTQGTSGLHLFDLSMASTGLTEKAASSAGMNVKTITIEENNRPEFMPDYEVITLKVVYEEESRRILGAQVISKADVTQSINTLSVCIQNNMTVDELGFIDFFFQPHFNKPWNFLNQAGLQAIQ
ncbi:CoA-disulfide reductase [Guptibacillus hwajinpoensis]|uniref:NADPH-dependent 2,4-dienoyl-CoA reductase/sulfur reductase-like enzyme n=1 Tax=Guptibacillus hwajinpoensis TaxID=208199 RepID=A0ABU0K476_9BACL|nr:CoA-disulfide reductase [Alkalihalobacillus hemicentroti]MDQ0484168.1 NADPH-dependent 2,4-dienoyl-CoA reductase/sulfur reductase-like enzyme [Alkalihalobacillus hemicentroti]